MTTRPPPILLLDGGLGTTLGDPPHNITFTAETPLWSAHLLISSPSTLEEVHRAFATVGADIVLTATYQTSFEGFTLTDSRYTREDAARYMRSAIPLARRAGSASGRPVKVALSLGPYGATMSPVGAEYTGLYPEEMDSESKLREWHARRLSVFVDETGTWDNFEYIAFETVKRTDEVRAIRGAMSDVLADMYQGQGPDPEKSQLAVGKKKPWWVCGVFPEEEVDEEDVRAWVRAAVGTQEGETGVNLPRPWGIGVNCTRIGNVGRIVAIMQDELRNLHELGTKGYVDEWDSVTGRPWLVLYPDGTNGEKYDPVTKTWVATDTGKETRPWDEIYWDVVRGVPEGAWEGVVMGGCCRAGPEQIATLRRRIDERSNAQGA